MMAAVSNLINVGLLCMRPLQRWLRTGQDRAQDHCSQRGNPFCMIKVTQLTQLLTCLGCVEENLVPIQRSLAGSFFSSQDDGYSPQGLRSDSRWSHNSRSVEGKLLSFRAAYIQVPKPGSKHPVESGAEAPRFGNRE